MATSDSSPLSRTAVIDAATRVVARCSDHRMLWSAIAREAGSEQAELDPAWFGDVAELIDACYARTAQAFMDSLLQAETAPGTALDQVAAFLVAILEMRRQRGTLLSFRRGRDLPMPLQRRLHERDMMVRMRLKRILNKGRGDGSLALRNVDSACELILASLQVADIAAEEPSRGCGTASWWSFSWLRSRPCTRPALFAAAAVTSLPPARSPRCPKWASPNDTSTKGPDEGPRWPAAKLVLPVFIAGAETSHARATGTPAHRSHPGPHGRLPRRCGPSEGRPGGRCLQGRSRQHARRTRRHAGRAGGTRAPEHEDVCRAGGQCRASTRRWSASSWARITRR